MDQEKKERIEKVAKFIKKKFREEYKITDFRDPFKVISLLDNY